MPELPEVEALRRRIEVRALNRTILAVTPGNDVTHIELPSAEERARLEGHQFTEARRHGKYLFAGSASGPWMMLHMGMAGSIRVLDTDEPQADFIRLTVDFEGPRRLTFRDPRKFGWVRVIDDPDAVIADHDLGPDALSIGEAGFADRVGTCRGAVKSALLDQGKLAGIGNLWADEALYQAGIHPEARAADLSEEAVARLHRTAIRVLQSVCDTDATYSELPDAWLIHRREAGRACTRCDGAIDKIKVGGRTSYHCPDHQDRAA
ncbi:Fpg/Nei family DNA glycosylase [Jannaschia ovalis]|uniref:DNA-formamidopyrimidine glycosylase family protein n=1 Tax=Jannaschia ovalis TaxID=3038773 RepID=A0ABY8LC88_9RHOB|nr:DNA-formamidopyrimidine glycosylase family protein [Jannaschia sp. GRR-S6-38]WGH77895.1 DNA-formamidopyrimidine glycosylase family protein [Jannaschia sp. GRR-S6-38]